MVATTTNIVAQAQDGERKRKMSLERTKCHHLCRQLQMRLQYARLKVERGWEKQSLNEVENLYFHHSTVRGPRPSYSIPGETTPQPEKSPYPESSTPRPYLAQPRGATPAIETGGAASSSRGVNPYMCLTGNTARPNPVSRSATPGQMLPPPSTPTRTPMVVEPPHPGSAVPLQTPLPSPKSPKRRATPQSVLESPVTLVSSSRHSQHTFPALLPGSTQRSSGAPHQGQAAPSRGTPLSPSPSPATNPKAIKQKVAPSPKATLPSAAPSAVNTSYYKQDVFNFGTMPTSGMTYEGFWSNHLSSSPRTNLRTAAYTMLSTPAATPGPASSQAPV